MADRMTVIAQLGTLITDAVQRGDDRASVTLRDALELIVSDKAIVEKDERRRSADRQRKPKRVPPIPRNSTESAEIHGGSQGFSPTPPFPNPPESSRDTAREAPIDAEYASAVERYTGMVANRMGALWPDVDAFVKRRDYATWRGWLKEVLTSLTGGSAEPEDVAQVCRDDEALDRRIGSPKGFRIFVASAARERQEAVRCPPTGAYGARGGIAQRAYATTLDAIKDMP